MADNSRFQGVIPPVVVPLTAEKQLDVPAFERSINRMIDGGVHGLFFLGSSGEVAFLNDEQRYQLRLIGLARAELAEVHILRQKVGFQLCNVVDFSHGHDAEAPQV